MDLERYIMFLTIPLQFLVRLKYLVADGFKRVFRFLDILLWCIKNLRNLINESAEITIQIIQFLNRIVVKRLFPCRIENRPIAILHLYDANTIRIVQSLHFLVKPIIYFKGYQIAEVCPIGIGQGLKVVLLQLII